MRLEDSEEIDRLLALLRQEQDHAKFLESLTRFASCLTRSARTRRKRSRLDQSVQKDRSARQVPPFRRRGYIHSMPSDQDPTRVRVRTVPHWQSIVSQGEMEWQRRNRIEHLNPTMLPGNPRIARWMIVIVISVLVIVLIGLAELRNKPVLQKQVPLHPSTLIVSHCLSSVRMRSQDPHPIRSQLLRHFAYF